MLPSELVKYKEKSQKIIALTAWDSISGSIAEEANVDLVLVGDSLAMVCLGYKSTLPLTLENVIYHTNAVSRGFKKKIDKQPLVVSDMPFLTYQCGEDKAVEYAGKIIQSTYAKAVKIEGAEPEIQKVISRLIRMGIPVMGHIGLTPQSYLNLGLKKQGESLESQGKIKEEASIRGLSVSALIDEQNKIRQEAEAKAAEQNRIARQEYLRDYPFYAKISCNMFGSQYSIILCFSGEYTETTITLEANGQSREKKFYNFTDLGYYEGDTLVIDLPRNFNLSAQNASDDATLTVEVYDRETNELLHVDEASSLFGIAGTYN